ncbi:MAG TPA: sigma factor-like helix-turn-helix DNA-binding protein [Candidatus Limnocylindrales bacterium]
MRVATNKALSARRSSVRLVHVASLPDAAGAGDPAADASDRIALLAAVDRLPAQMRAAVVLRYYADLPVEGVAAALGKSANTIKSQLQTALDRMRTTLADPAAAPGETSHA